LLPSSTTWAEELDVSAVALDVNSAYTPPVETRPMVISAMVASGCRRPAERERLVARE
jgi:hypothetical protein